MNNDYFPEGYTLPDKSNGYMKLKTGENRIRIMSKPIIGNEWWVEEDGIRRPKRVRMGQAVPAEYADKVRHFWAFVVWNYEGNQLQILELTQRSIMEPIKDLSKDEDYGSPLGYDLVIKRTGETMLETEYAVRAKPPMPVTASIKEAYEQAHVNLEVLFEGTDPFLQTGAEEAREDVEEEEVELPSEIVQPD